MTQKFLICSIGSKDSLNNVYHISSEYFLDIREILFDFIFILYPGNEFCMRLMISVFCFVLLFSSCQKEEQEPIIITSIEQAFNITPWQTLEPGFEGFELVISTSEAQECTNSMLDIEHTVDSGLIEINIHGVNTDGACIQGESYPAESIPLGNEPGIYDLVINIGSNIENTGTIDLTAEKLSLQMTETSGLTLEEEEIFDVPDGITWGFLDNRVAGTTELSSLAGIIQQEIDLIYNMNEGNYGYFVVGDLGAIEIADAGPDVTSMLLDVRDPAKWQRLKELLIEFEGKYPDLKYEFTRWDGLQVWN